MCPRGQCPWSGCDCEHRTDDATRSVEVTLATGRVLTVKTTHVCPPIPDRRSDWTAVDDRTYEAGCPVGVGATEKEAIDDLVEQVCNALDICPPDCWCQREAVHG